MRGFPSLFIDLSQFSYHNVIMKSLLPCSFLGMFSLQMTFGAALQNEWKEPVKPCFKDTQFSLFFQTFLAASGIPVPAARRPAYQISQPVPQQGRSLVVQSRPSNRTTFKVGLSFYYFSAISPL